MEAKSPRFAAQHALAAESGAYGLEEPSALPLTVFSPPADTLDGRSAAGAPDTGTRGTDRRGPGGGGAVGAEEAVTALYHVHAAGMIRLAVVMLGDRAAAEDVVQDAFYALFRRFSSLAQPDRAVQYVRSSVLNGCRSELRSRTRRARRIVTTLSPDVASAEHDALVGEEHRQVLRALRRLPDRQREALVLRFFVDLPDPQIAQSMGISQGTVKSTTSRALAALANLLGEDQ